MNDLEKYLRDNRHRADVHHPPDDIWNKVQENIKPARSPSMVQVNRWWLVAAGVAILLAFTAIYMNVVKPSQELLVKLDERLMSIDSYYATQMGEMQALIKNRRSEIDQHMTSYPQLQPIFSKDVEQLSSTYDNLRTNLFEIENEEVLLKAMMSNLQLQIEVLNRQLGIIQEIQKNKKNEASNPII